MKPFSELLTDWRKASDGVIDIAEKLPRIIGVESKRAIKQNFEKQGYDDGLTFTPWETRSPGTNYRYDKRYGVKGTVANSDSKILSQSRNLEDGVHAKVKGRSVSVGVNLDVIPYGQIHNEGLMGKAWGKYPFKMPKRQYIPVNKPNVKILLAVQKKVKFMIEWSMKPFKK